jgi:hypothetical protein
MMKSIVTCPADMTKVNDEALVIDVQRVLERPSGAAQNSEHPPKEWTIIADVRVEATKQKLSS